MERAASDNDMTADDSVRRSRWRRKRWAALLVVLGALLLAGLGLWLSRERIVDDIIRSLGGGRGAKGEEQWRGAKEEEQWRGREAWERTNGQEGRSGRGNPQTHVL